MITVFRHEPRQVLQQFGSTALHAILGWAAVAPLWIPIVYFIALKPLRATARRMERP
jgi:hypothetical protein